MSEIKGTKIVFEWGSEDNEPPDFQQQEFVCESYKLTPTALVMTRVQMERSGWIWEEVGIPLAGLRRWLAGDGVSDAELLPRKGPAT